MNQKDLPYRKGANAIIIDKDNNILVVQKQSYADNEWEFPGGGLEEGESPEEGVLRELREELGSEDFEIIKESPFIHRFEWPKEVREARFTKHGKWWRGQEKHQFIVRFTGQKDALTPQEEEIRKIKWLSYKELETHLIFGGQWENAKRVMEEAKLDKPKHIK